MNEQQSQLVLNNVGLAYNFAKPYRFHPRYTDIVQSCLLGLCEAALRWNPKLKHTATFSTYAYFWMKHCTNKQLDQESMPASVMIEMYEVPETDKQEELLVNTFYMSRLRELLYRFLYELPENERHAILLRFPLDSHSRTYTDVDIAMMLGCSPSLVGNLRRKAFSKLKEKLEKEFCHE